MESLRLEKTSNILQSNLANPNKCRLLTLKPGKLPGTKPYVSTKAKETTKVAGS